MPQLFSKKANRLPGLTLAGLTFGGLLTIGVIWYYFSPEYTDVGYQPVQPVPYSHEQHVNQFGMDCRYCHSYVEEAAHSNIPSTQTCMNCHHQIKTESLKLLPVRESWATGDPVPWIKVHHLPDYAHFNHSVHVKIGVGCETCHGRIDQMEIVTQQEPLSMGWCLSCHRAPEENLRPPEEVTTMGWVPADDQVEKNLQRIEAEGIYPPTECSGCHY
jgi:hypothetical protein